MLNRPERTTGERLSDARTILAGLRGIEAEQFAAGEWDRLDFTRLQIDETKDEIDDLTAKRLAAMRAAVAKAIGS